MKQHTLSSRVAVRGMRRFSALAVACSLVLGGCTLPADYDAASVTSPDALGYSALMSDIQAMDWPGDVWWQRYQDPQLNRLISQALSDSPTINMAKARLKGAEGVASQVGALKYLQVGAGATASLTKVSEGYQAPMPPPDWNDYGTLTMDFSYDFDFWGKNSAAVAAATSDYAATQAEVAGARLMLSTSVANAYAELARLYANQDTVEAALAVRSKTVELLTKRFNSGLEAKGAVSQAKAAAASVEGELLSVQEAITLQKYAIAALLGEGPDRAATISRPAVALSHTYGLPADLGIGLLGHRPDISAARWRAESAASRIGVAKAQFYPDVRLSGFIGYQAFGLDNLFNDGNDAGSIGPAVYLPIFNGGRLQGQLTSAEAGYEMAVASYNDTLTHALQDLASVMTSARALDAQIAKSEQAVASAAEAHQAMSNRYNGGLASYLQVLTAENLLLNSQRALVNLQSKAFSLDIALVHALGGGFDAQNTSSQAESGSQAD